jgi:hypothetical protein
MSKKTTKKFRKQKKTAEISLKNLAKALDTCQSNSIHIKWVQGIAMCEYGYVFLIKGRWVVRMLHGTTFPGFDSDDD